MKKQKWVQTYRNKINRPLRKKLRYLRASSSKSAVRIIIQFRNKMISKGMLSLKKQLGTLAFPIKHKLPFINAVAATLSAKRIQSLCSSKSVAKIYADGRKKATLNTATPSIGSASAQRKGLTGKGVTIAFIDTGVFPHPDLTRPRNRIVGFKDFINRRTSPYDDNGHGTHVAGDAAGNGLSSKGKFKGPAPKAGIVSVKVLDRSGIGFDSTIIKGIEWCVNNRRRLGIRILSLSLGGTAETSYQDDPLCQALEKAARAGLVVVVAAGNGGPIRGSIDSPGTSPSAITVGAANDRRTIIQADDTIAPFSGRGPALGGLNKPDLVAPGVGIVSLRVPGSLLDMQIPSARVGKRYFRLSGTSMSTPLVTGASAQILQKNPRLTPKQVKTILKSRAFNLNRSVKTQGSGEVNVRFI